MKNNLFIGILGNRDAGKSTTWYNLFEDRVKTSNHIRKLKLSETEYIEVFLINGSPEERGISAEDMIGSLKPRIVLCAIQYIEEVVYTIEYFKQNDFSMYIQWLNPGKNDQNETPQFDNLGLINKLLTNYNCILSIRNGKDDPDDRVHEIVEYLYGWGHERGLIHTV